MLKVKPLRSALGLLLVCLCWATALAGEASRQPALVQVGVIDALLAGQYDGSLGLGELRTLGDIGLGTFDALDGELVLLDGVIYQVPASGIVRRPADTLSTPFAQVARMPAPFAKTLSARAELKAVEDELDAALGDLNAFAVVRIDARFAKLTARSVPRQTKPYRPLAEVAKEQALFELRDVPGTLVALRGPAFAKGLGVPGWHWHFLTQDRSRGGHVLSFTLAAGSAPQAKIQRLRRFELLLPEKGLAGVDLARDRAAELKAVESGQ